MYRLSAMRAAALSPECLNFDRSWDLGASAVFFTSVGALPALKVLKWAFLFGLVGANATATAASCPTLTNLSWTRDVQQEAAVAEAWIWLVGVSHLISLDIHNRLSVLFASDEWLTPILGPLCVTPLRLSWGNWTPVRPMTIVDAILQNARLLSTLGCDGIRMTVIDVMMLCEGPYAESSINSSLCPDGVVW